MVAVQEMLRLLLLSWAAIEGTDYCIDETEQGAASFLILTVIADAIDPGVVYCWNRHWIWKPLDCLDHGICSTLMQIPTNAVTP